jgi:hypothetical protein
MSPREFYALADCYQERLEHFDWHMAGLKAVIANCAGIKITAEDFMGKSKKFDERQLELQLTSLFGCGPVLQKKVKNG